MKSDLRNKNGFVTGATGLLGSWLVKDIVEKQAKRLLGWAPRYSIKKGLSETIAWYTSYFKRKWQKKK